jgi:hypothetical protein
MSIALGSDRFTKMHRLLRFGAKVGGLITGFVVGQGSVFAVQTWLITEGKLSVVASFGFAIAILSLVQWTADWGGHVLLARYAVLEHDFQGVWAANAARLIIAAPIVGGLATFAVLYATTDPFASGMLFGGLAIAPIWSLNLAGFLDGHGKSAFSGPIAGLPWVATAVTTFLIFLFSDASFSTGLLVGGSYTVGCTLCVALQYMLVRSVVVVGSPRQMTRADAVAYFCHGGIYCLAEFPHQLYGRALIMIVSVALGQQIAGMYVYIHQVLIGFAQIIGFVKRVEFPRLASALLELPLRLRRVVAAQLVNLGASGLVIVAAFAAFQFRDWLPQHFSEIAFYFVFFAAVLPVWALSVSFGQVLILQHKMTAYSGVLLSTIALSAIITTEFTQTFGLTLIAWCQITIYVVQTALFAHIACRTRT